MTRAKREFRKEWEDIQPEMDVIRAMVDARISQNLTQKELAERTGINQADISKLENGTRNPSLKLLKLKHSQTPSRAGGESCTQVAINGVAKEQIRQIIADNNFTRL